MHQNVGALLGLRSDPVSYHHWDTLSSSCYTALGAFWVSRDVLYWSRLLLVCVSESRSCVKVEVPVLTSLMVSVNVKQH